MQNFSSIAMAFAMIAAFLLAAGGVRLLRDRQTRVRGILMVVVSVVIIMNVTIWTV